LRVTKSSNCKGHTRYTLYLMPLQLLEAYVNIKMTDESVREKWLPKEHFNMGEETKESLIEAAIKLFEEQGYHSTKVSDIVREAGVAQGTFYLYFKSKEDMFRYIAETCLDEIAFALTEDGGCSGSDEEQYYRMIHRALESYFDNKAILKIINRHGVASQEIAEVSEAFYHKMMLIIKRTLKESKKYANYSDLQLEIAAYAKIGMVEMVAYQWFVVKNYSAEYIDSITQIVVGMSSPCKIEKKE
jgi:AcrR family transcriptional regulator